MRHHYKTLQPDEDFPEITKEHCNQVFRKGENYYFAEKTTKRWYIIALNIKCHLLYRAFEECNEEVLRILHAVTIKPNPPSESQHHKFF